MKNLKKLKIDSSWGYLTYQVENKEVLNLKEVFVKVKEKFLKLKVRKTIRLSSYSEMGRISNVECPDFCVKIKNKLGVNVEMSLYELNEKKKLFVDIKKVSFK